jgi:hypothetical protein
MASATAYFISSPSAPRSIVQAIVLCAIILGYEKTVTALFSNRCVEDFIPTQRHVEVLTDQSPSHRPSSDSEEALATGWRSM